MSVSGTVVARPCPVLHAFCYRMLPDAFTSSSAIVIHAAKMEKKNFHYRRGMKLRYMRLLLLCYQGSCSCKAKMVLEFLTSKC